ncbi:hypothetical protein [Streptomyces cellulosae]|uniref:hypothetical protein n=1 Tax=Streptomyces cellulosae TaxID=1968 RepID=UPI001F27CE6E|nr:hypothetical protein [Streptomyces cellulosae]
MRAFVRRDDKRAQSLREAGAEVFVGDLLKLADVAAALKGATERSGAKHDATRWPTE